MKGSTSRCSTPVSKNQSSGPKWASFVPQYIMSFFFSSPPPPPQPPPPFSTCKAGLYSTLAWSLMPSMTRRGTTGAELGCCPPRMRKLRSTLLGTPNCQWFPRLRLGCSWIEPCILRLLPGILPFLSSSSFIVHSI